MAGRLSRFPREKLLEARSERIWPFLQEIVLRLKLQPPEHRLFSFDLNLNPIEMEYGLADWKEGKTTSSIPFLTETGKMNCFSFSLPAGNPNVMGTCFMEGGQAKDYLCKYCYAGKGMYIKNPSNQLAQACRWKWADSALYETGDFVDQMATALDQTFSSDLHATGADANQFFRLHDSGDFYSLEYLAGWFAVIREFPDVKFWAPTRMWARPEFKDWIEAAGGVPSNLALRPSSLFINKPAKDVPGLAAGSTMHEHKIGTFSEPKKGGGQGYFVKLEGKTIWECPAYRSGSESCLGAADVGIKVGSPYGCRFCWIGKKMQVSYKGH